MNDVQRLNLYRHPILQAIYDVMQAIERCGASPELTEAVALASRLSGQAAAILDERDALRAMYRPEVAWFAGIMEERLRANDHKGGWRGDRPVDLMLRLYQEAAELYEEIRPGFSAVPSRVESEAADVANFAMMIADVCGGTAARAMGPKHG